MGGDRKAIFFDIITKGHAWVCDGYEVRQTQYASLVWGSKFNIPDMEEPDYFSPMVPMIPLNFFI